MDCGLSWALLGLWTFLATLSRRWFTLLPYWLIPLVVVLIIHVLMTSPFPRDTIKLLWLICQLEIQTQWGLGMFGLLFEEPTTETLWLETLNVMGNLKLVGCHDLFSCSSRTFHEFGIVLTNSFVTLNYIVQFFVWNASSAYSLSDAKKVLNLSALCPIVSMNMVGSGPSFCLTSMGNSDLFGWYVSACLTLVSQLW